MNAPASEFRNPAATARLAIIGGGQLARMTALAAAPLGCEVVTLEATAGGPAAQVTPRAVTGAWADAELLANLAAGADVVTLENEFVDAGALRRLEEAGHVVRPGSACLALTRRKMNLAAEFLLESGGLVKEAALRVGFADPYHFSRCFKSVHGVAPSDLLRYRRAS